MKKTGLFVITTLLFILYIGAIGLAKNNSVIKKKPQKTLSSQNANARIDINNINALESIYGFSDFNLNSNLEGLEFPKGSGKTAVFESGFLWGGYVAGDPQVRVGGSAYLSGLEPGPILSDGQPADPTDSRWSIYTVRPDIYPGGPPVDLSDEVKAYAEGGQEVTETSLRDQYEYNWLNWPAAGTSNDLGAPYTDVNHDGKYESDIDIPGVPGADQTVFYVANDMDQNLTIGMYGTQPLGIELHATFWAYNQGGLLNNVYFKKYTLINKGYQHYQIDSMFISFWVDPDLGYAQDDLVGTDSLLNLIYTYNGSPVDAIYSNSPPTVGFHLLEGPMVPGNNYDTALFNGRTISGNKNLPITAAYTFTNPGSGYDTTFNDPQQGELIGSTQFYNFMKGENNIGAPYIDPQTNQVTKFIFSGDPVTGTGWIDGSTFGPRDVRSGMSFGPFNFAPEDTQEVIFAELVAEKDKLPASYLTGITNLKKNTKYINSFFHNGVLLEISAVSCANINNQVNLSANVVPQNSQVNSINWSIIGKPNGSNATVMDPSEKNTSFIPDLAGDYEIKLNMVINGIETFDIKSIKAVNNRKPTAILKSDLVEINSTDSLLVKFNESYDLDGDSLNYTLIGKGLFKFQNASGTAYFFPDPAFIGNEEISLIASDLYSYDSTSIKIKVKPKLEDITINFSFIDTNWSSNSLNGFPFFYGKDSIYIPLHNSLRRYSIKSDGIIFEQEFNNIKITGIWNILNNLLMGSSNSIIGNFGTTGRLNIFDLSNNGANLLSNYLPGNGYMDIQSIYSIGSDIFLMDYYGNIFKIDFSKPSLPNIVALNQLQLYNAVIFYYDSFYIYVIGRRTDYNSFYVNRLNRTSLKLENSLILPFSPSYNLVVHDSLLVVSNPYSDSLYFYYLDGLNSPTLLRELKISSLFENPFPNYNTSLNFTVCFVDKYLEIDNYSSSKLYDISDINNIKLFAACYGGGMKYIKNGENYFLILSDPRSFNVNNPYSGINGISINSIDGIGNTKEAAEIPLKYNLYQNYPNPFNPRTTISYSIPRISFITLKIYDVLGREIETIVNEQKPAGNYKVNFNAGGLASGVYFYQLRAGDFVSTKKLILLK